MPKLFVSYRRDDSLDITGRIFDRLGNHFGQDAVFMDIDTIPFGVDFRSFLNDWIKECDAVIVVIGDRWMTSTYEGGPKHGQGRLEDPADFVRIEVAAALARKIPVIPWAASTFHFARAQSCPRDVVLQGWTVTRNQVTLPKGKDDVLWHVEPR